jgi:hypothetical protein
MRPPYRDWQASGGEGPWFIVEQPLLRIAVTPTTIREVNDLAFFLAAAGEVKLALVLLEQVVAHDRERAVAWLNLADTKWRHQDSAQHEGAGSAYRQYIEIMTSRGREGSIPTRVWQRAAVAKPESSR